MNLGRDASLCHADIMPHRLGRCVLFSIVLQSFLLRRKGSEIRYLTPTAVIVYFLESKENEYTGFDILLNESRPSDTQRNHGRTEIKA